MMVCGINMNEVYIGPQNQNNQTYFQKFMKGKNLCFESSKTVVCVQNLNFATMLKSASQSIF